jgi:hypothetical protein
MFPPLALARGLPALALAIALSAPALLAAAQDTVILAQADHAGHDMTHRGPEHAAPPAKPEKKPAAALKKQKRKPDHGHSAAHAAPVKRAAPGSQGHAKHDDAAHEHETMKAFLGPYPFTREASGTSWQPDTSPHQGIHSSYGDWSLMWHALINGVYDKQGGPRGGEKTFASGMIMGMAERQVGDGTFGLRAMLSPDAFMGPSGYPLLFAAGETADGKTLLVDRQHPHDLFMELAASYSYDLSAKSSVFVYAGLPGEPALGPPTFMHRVSGMDNPEAPISHHWLDSTHITFGVVTVGTVVDTWKIEASAFRGREPDQYRFDIEAPSLDSVSARLSWNPLRELSMQVSWGRIHSPEQLQPNIDEDRITASAIYTQPFGNNNLWSSTFAWGRKIEHPGETFDAFLLESAAIFQQTYTLFMRAERIDAHELFSDMPGVAPALAQGAFPVGKLSLGGIYDFPVADHLKLGVGGLVSRYGIPGELKPFYGSDPTSYMVFVRLKVL